MIHIVSVDLSVQKGKVSSNLAREICLDWEVAGREVRESDPVKSPDLACNTRVTFRWIAAANSDLLVLVQCQRFSLVVEVWIFTELVIAVLQ